MISWSSSMAGRWRFRARWARSRNSPSSCRERKRVYERADPGRRRRTGRRRTLPPAIPQRAARLALRHGVRAKRPGGFAARRRGGKREPHSDPLRRQHARHERPRTAAARQRGAARRARHHDHRLWRFGNTAKGHRSRRRRAFHQADRLSRIARRDRPPAGRRDGSPMTAKVLVVDDEPDLEDLIRQKFRRQIKDGSIAFGFARDGVEALAFLAENRDFDMVVSDINMPRMDGLTLLAKMQDEATRFSTVIVSAYGDMANIRTAMNRGAFDFLTKPIDFADFETTVRKTIAHVADLRDARLRQAAAERAHASLSRYFSPNLARSLAADANALAPGGERREIATLFTDIAGFTPLVESLDPRELASLLSGYLEAMTEIVFAHEGTVAKIIGDAIHVLFGAPVDQPNAASRAIACALALDTHAEQYRHEWIARGGRSASRASAFMRD